jgi:hypothetical protein
VSAIAEQYERHAVRLFAAALLLGEAIAIALREPETQPPKELYERIANASQRCAALASGRAIERAPAEKMEAQPPETQDEISPAWRPCLDHIRLVEEVITVFEAGSTATAKATQ